METNNGRIWFSPSNAVHPLVDPTTAQALLDKLPERDPLAVLAKITEWIDEIVQVPELPLQRLFDVLDQFDSHAQKRQVRLVPEYLDTPRMLKLCESQLWATSFHYWQAIGNGYLRCLERIQAGEGEPKTVRLKLPVIVNRALRSLHLQVKWTLLRYARVEDRLWRDLGRAYLFAFSRNFATHHSLVYPGEDESSPLVELLNTFMLYVSSPDTLPPVQQHIAERIVTHFGSWFAMQTTFSPGCQFTFDLAMHLPPARANKDTLPAPLLFFFGPGVAVQGLGSLKTHLESQGNLPSNVALGGNFQSKDIHLVVDHLLRCWNEIPVTRRSRRQEILTRMTVVPGFTEAIKWFQWMLDTTTKERIEPTNAESWVVMDTSDGGYGAVLSASTGDWLKVGALAGIEIESDRSHHLGILRRIVGEGNDQLHVGIQLIGNTAVPVSLFAAKNLSGSVSRKTGEPAFLITNRPDHNQCIELVFRAGSFLYNSSLQMGMRYGERLLEIDYIKTIEKTEDYHWACYRLVSD